MNYEQLSLPFSACPPNAPEISGRLNAHALPPGGGFFDELAARALTCYPSLYPGTDLSALRVLTPSPFLASELRAALARAMRGAALLPRCDTLRHWAMTAPLAGIPDPLPESERRVLLYEALRQKAWFDEAALWSIVGEMTELFDALTAAELRLPDDEAALAEQLQRAYATRASAPLAFEARIVHSLWHALGTGTPDAATLYRLRLAELARAARNSPPSPLLVLLDAAPDEALFPAERDFLQRYGERQCVHVFYPEPRETGATPLLATLATAWPASHRPSTPSASSTPSTPLLERARRLATKYPVSPLDGRLCLVPASGREQEARAAVAQVAAWLQAGLRRIALIAQDRLTARRVRALLEREGVRVNDETGWLLSTSRAAATIDALLEVTSAQAYHRDFIDLCKSPFVFADIDAAARAVAVSTLEAAIRAASAKLGFKRFRRALLESDRTEASQAVALLDRVEAAAALLHARPAPLAHWLERLRAALDTLGALDALAEDAVGQTLLDLLEERRNELAGNDSLFSFKCWRDWLDREFEAASFRDAGMSSPIVITSLKTVQLRRFEAALLLGGDAQQLAPPQQAVFFNTSVRRELGLPTREDGERDLKRALGLLLSMTPRVVVTWQERRDGEANLPAPELSLLSSLHHLAWNDDLMRHPLPPRREAEVTASTAPRDGMCSAPTAPEQVPRRISVSAYASLVACPYRFFARHMLALNEMDEVIEEVSKREYGELIHRILEQFHAQTPLVSDLPDDEALNALRACSDRVFAPAIADDFLATGWRLRWEKHLPAYLVWQRAREAEGWRWKKAEMRVSHTLALDGGECIELYGRIDRIDQRAPDKVALYDYKMQKEHDIRKRLADDVQLPAYALMYGASAEAAYIALDGDTVSTVDSGKAETLHEAAACQGERLRASFSALLAGAPLPANGIDSVCQWCEMRGLCRA